MEQPPLTTTTPQPTTHNHTSRQSSNNNRLIPRNRKSHCTPLYHLASLGANIVINYTSPSSLPHAEQLISQINSLPHSSTSTIPCAIAVQADVSDETQVKSLFTTAEQTFNTQPHILITSVGIGDPTFSPLSRLSIRQHLRCQLSGTFLCIKEAANRLMHGGGGRIVTLSSSLVATFTENYGGAYMASKAVVEAMTKIMAKELKGSGITVNAVARRPVATEMFFAGKSEEMVKKFIDQNPLGRLGKVEDIANVVGFLVSDAGEWVNGQVTRVNGGYV